MYLKKGKGNDKWDEKLKLANLPLGLPYKYAFQTNIFIQSPKPCVHAVLILCGFTSLHLLVLRGCVRLCVHQVKGQGQEIVMEDVNVSSQSAHLPCNPDTS